MKTNETLVAQSRQSSWLAVLFRRAAFVSLAAITLGLGMLLAAAMFARFRPVWEPLSNLRTPFAACLLVVAAAWFAWGRVQSRLRWIGLVCLIAGLFGLRPAYGLLGMGAGEFETDTPELRLGSVNLLFGIGHPEPVYAWMAEEELDVVGFLEMKESERSKLRWPRLLASWSKAYPFQFIEEHPTYGMALISKVPLTDHQVFFGKGGHGVESTRPMRMQVQLQWHTEVLTLCLVHPPRPDHNWRMGVREEFFDTLATQLPKKGSLVVLGDFNANEGSPMFRDLRSRVGLQDSRKGHGYLPSWRPHWLSLPLVPLDHILVRGPQVLRRGVGPDVRSDHRPIHAVLAWPSSQSKPPKPH